MKLKQAFIKAGKFLVKKSPEIAIIFGVVGIGLTVYETVKVTKKVETIIATEEANREEPLTGKEKVKIVAKVGWPTVAMAACTTGCFIFAFTKKAKGLKAATYGLQLANSQLKSYEDAVLDAVGKEKADEIHKKWVNSRAQEKIDQIPPDDIPLPRDGEYLFFEPLTGTPFSSTFDEVYAAMRYVNDCRDSDPFAGPIMFKEFLGSLPTLKDAQEADIGVMLGWPIKKDLKDRIELIAENETVKTCRGPAYLLEYSPAPTWVYDY